ncbi:hypothetical protein EGM63_21290 [Mycobacterium avium subsp. paratuberculosis]|uniref:Uncharacterized protein n=1 Tax=Mycolicibacterium paratuberculosis (strain ATCC BAA-968 / K-10) TaxID=262316 RepID=Q73ZJ3_MYCPA|nr:hypothetical protein MAP_1610 [Mycobacterium avium subsp. paratuberculosis K-10]AGL37133.1 hypothetical protein MAP4_2229 [Mycobacterium avium subsp. paratuberculosis MAP4]ASE15460.1 hypothetical protein CEP84_18095 [Mycobacterium avium subsp. paratuberculosis]ASF95806.1 hypothetical protein CEG92_08405 [Mycobacterium avium subsp. paratuberculosis]AYQ70202.1 hypothetical protein EC390_19500 [Mycobacterium avium subsp. paratuberculosis]
MSDVVACDRGLTGIYRVSPSNVDRDANESRFRISFRLAGFHLAISPPAAPGGDGCGDTRSAPVQPVSNRRAAKHPGRRGFLRVGQRANRSPVSFRMQFAVEESMHSALPCDPFSGGLSGDSATGLFPTADRALPAFRGPRRLSRSKPMKTALSRVCSGSHEPVYQRFHGARQRVWERSAGPIGAQIWTRYLACR